MATWQERLESYKTDPAALAKEIERTATVLGKGANADAGDWLSKLSGVAKQVNNNGGSVALQNTGGSSGSTYQPQSQQQPTIVQQPQTVIPQAPVQPQRNITDITTQLQKIMGTYNFPYEQMLRDLTAQPSAYKAPTESEMLTQAQQYAGLQVDPLISALQNQLNSSKTSFGNAKNQIESAYANIPNVTQARLDEARQYAQNNAISRGMGRSGLLDYNTNKLSAPIIQAETDAQREKATKLSAIANELANVESENARMLQEAQTRRGTLESSKLSEIKQLAQQLAAQEQQQKFNQGQTLASFGQQANLAQQQLLAQLVPLFMNG